MTDGEEAVDRGHRRWLAVVGIAVLALAATLFVRTGGDPSRAGGTDLTATASPAGVGPKGLDLDDFRASRTTPIAEGGDESTTTDDNAVDDTTVTTAIAEARPEPPSRTSAGATAAPTSTLPTPEASPLAPDDPPPTPEATPTTASPTATSAPTTSPPTTAPATTSTAKPGGGGSPPPPSPVTVTVTARSLAYQYPEGYSRDMTLAVGSRIRFDNTEVNNGTEHSFTIEGGWTSGRMAASDPARTSTELTAGTFAYRCIVHPATMQGTLTVI